MERRRRRGGESAEQALARSRSEGADWSRARSIPLGGSRLEQGSLDPVRREPIGAGHTEECPTKERWLFSRVFHRAI
eukprot:4499481-Pyramimonas_sp.AAC.3